MGLSSFLKGDTVPETSAFDAVPDDVREAIANDMVAIIECIKVWRAAAQSPEHAKAMMDEAKNVGRKLGGKFISMAVMGNDMMDKPDWYKNIGLPMAVVDVIDRVIAKLTEQESSNGTPAQSTP